MAMNSTHLWDVTDTHTARLSHKPPFYLFFQNKESSLIKGGITYGSMM
jgi:hypothetical protein